ncbi:TIGR01548 family HAD-type hydrolase [Laspinema olomoucense]|uniref:TIGR01548 family HAD-type hydrolase n=1 Tax=Laspinema olomoucense D3b TaxID=2953688 RepID=A0ABT2NB83_9CYAN|nr:TIGR01548 family HAD-type hydrolase [Laspinema sp. D3b]MCT7979963.1 TIGR01548 family HAD-type hydrolase [Laspinema sp. D3b]
MDTNMTTTAIAVFDIDGVIRDVSGSYRRAIADTVEHFTQTAYRPSSADIDRLKSEGVWNNDWDASFELVCRYFESQGQSRDRLSLDYDTLVNFFQSRYRGPDPLTMTGYICQEPLLVNPAYLDSLTQAGIPWGFFSGAMRAEAAYVLEGALGLTDPVVIAMEDAPGKPDPTGLFATLEQLQSRYSSVENAPVVYVGDTVADLYTVTQAKQQDPKRTWVGVGVLPPHVQESEERKNAYSATLKKAGAAIVLGNVKELTPALIAELVRGNT